MDVRYKVSSIARQSSSDIKTAEFLFPTICTGICESFTSSTRLYRRFLASDAVNDVIFLASLTYEIWYVINTTMSNDFKANEKLTGAL